MEDTARRLVKMKLKCPSCKSENITYYMGAQFGKYQCKKCGYVGVLIIEENKNSKLGNKADLQAPSYYRQEFRGHLVYLYDFDFKLVTLGMDKRLREIFVKRFPAKCKSILDMATGTGAVALTIKKELPNASVTGIDLSDTMLGIAQKKAQREQLQISFLLQNIEKTFFKNAQFDAITLSFGLHELPLEHRKNVFKEAHRLLKKGGRFIIMDYNKPGNILLRWLVYFHIFLKEKYAKTLLEQNLEEEMQKYGFHTSKEIYYGGMVQLVVGKK